jgi:hypothetical protein
MLRRELVLWQMALAERDYNRSALRRAQC